MVQTGVFEHRGYPQLWLHMAPFFCFWENADHLPNPTFGVVYFQTNRNLCFQTIKMLEISLNITCITRQTKTGPVISTHLWNGPQYPSNFPIKPSDFLGSNDGVGDGSHSPMAIHLLLAMDSLDSPKKSCFGFFSKNLLFTIQIHDLSDSKIFKICRMPSHIFDLLPQVGALQSKVSRAKEEIVSDSNSHSKSSNG